MCIFILCDMHAIIEKGVPEISTRVKNAVRIMVANIIVNASHVRTCDLNTTFNVFLFIMCACLILFIFVYIICLMVLFIICLCVVIGVYAKLLFVLCFSFISKC